VNLVWGFAGIGFDIDFSFYSSINFKSSSNLNLFNVSSASTSLLLLGLRFLNNTTSLDVSRLLFSSRVSSLSSFTYKNLPAISSIVCSSVASLRVFGSSKSSPSCGKSLGLGEDGDRFFIKLFSFSSF